MTMAQRALLGLSTLLLLASAGTRASAASIRLLPSTTSPVLGSTLEVLIYGTEFGDGVDGGDLSLAWFAPFEFVAIAIPDPPWDTSSYDASTASLGYLGFVDVFSFFETPGVGGVDFEIATVTLRAVAVGVAFVYVNRGSVGWSLAGETVPDVAYDASGPIEVLPIPEPSSVVLLTPFLTLLAWSRYRPRRT